MSIKWKREDYYTRKWGNLFRVCLLWAVYPYFTANVADDDGAARQAQKLCSACPPHSPFGVFLATLCCSGVY